MVRLVQHPTGLRPVSRHASWPRRCWQGLRGFLRARQGVTALEAAFILPVFFGFCFGFLETAMLYFNASVLEGRVADAARQIRTGNVQSAADPVAKFREILCGGPLALIKCNDIVIDVRNFSTFGTITYPAIYDDDGDPTNAVFQPGAAGAIVSVRVTYRWHLMTPFLGLLLADTSNDTKLIGAADIFRTEPYS